MWKILGLVAWLAFALPMYAGDMKDAQLRGLLVFSAISDGTQS